MSELHIEPLIAPALWITLAMVSALFVAWYARSRPASLRSARWAAIITLTAIGLGVVLVVLLNPMWIKPMRPPAGKPVLTILVDRSASMAAPDGHEQQTRYQSAIKAADEIARASGDRFDIRVQAFDHALMPTEINELATGRPQGTMTDLAGALTAAVSDDRPQGQAIVLLSDGIHNVGAGGDAIREAARQARAMAAPVYTLTEGGQTEVHDLAVQLRWPQELAFIGQTVPAVARIEHRGMRGASTEVVLTLGDREISRQSVQLLTEEPAEVRFDIRQDTEGLHRYEIRAEPISNEATAVNNTAAFILRTVDQPLRVLLLEGKPYWDTKFLVRTLAGDPAIRLDSVVQLTEHRWLHRTLRIAPTSQPAASTAPSVSVRREDWTIIANAADIIANRDSLKEYQIVVLGRDVEPFLDDEAVARLRQWIARDGGALVCFRGSPVAQIDQRLAPLMPVRWSPTTESRFHLQLTSEGKDVNWLTGAKQDELLGQMPSLATAMQVEPARPLTSVLARTTAAEGKAESTVISYQPYGMGRVVVIEGAGMWRWAFLPPQEQSRDDVYRGLWQSLLRWLASSTGLLPGQNIALHSDRAIFHTLENCTATLMARNESKAGAGFQIQLEGSSPAAAKSFAASPLGDEPGMFQVAFGRLPEGRYRAVLLKNGAADESVSAAFDVQPFLGEQLELNARPDIMARIAEESGGAVIAADDPATAIKNFEKHLDAGRSRRVQQIIAWDRWWILLSVFTVWGTAWALRRSGGLV